MKKLSDFGYDVYSQFGEDGILAAIFERLGEGNRVCIEFGAWDGFHLSNTANLWTNGWRGVLIEADEDRAAELQRNVSGYDCIGIRRFVGISPGQTLEDILAEHGLPLEADLLSIDVDGDDYYVLSSLKTLRPRVICCEYNPTFPPHLDLRPVPGARFGCSPLSLVRLAESQGYRLVAMTEGNCIFIRQEDHDRFSDYETGLRNLTTNKHLSYLISGFDGSWILSRRPTYGLRQPSHHPFVGPHFRPSLESPVPRWTWRRLVKAIRHRLMRKKSSPPDSAVDPKVLSAWRRDRGDETLRLSYPLDSDSLVFDIGGYRGQWTSDLFAMYGCRIHVFEPISEFATTIRSRFSRNDRIQIHGYGLGAETERVTFFSDEDRSSAHHGEGAGREVLVRAAEEVIEEKGIEEIHLMKINIEGGEYDLMDHILDTGLIHRIRDLQVQFHSFMPSAERRRFDIRQRLAATHDLTYDYPFVWENWQRRDSESAS